MSVESHERELLGAILDGEAVALEYAAQLHPDDMSTDRHRLILGAILPLHRDENPISINTVCDQLGDRLERAGGRELLAELRGAAIMLGAKYRAGNVKVIREGSLGRRIKAKAEAISLMNGAATAGLQREAAALAEMAADSVSGTIQNLADIPSLFELDIPETSFIVPGILPARQATVLAGQSGTGKSFLALKLGIAVATGGRLLGRECEQRAVLYLDRENSDSEVKKRIQIMAGGDVPGLKVWGDWLAEGPPDLVDPRLLKMAKQCGPVIVVDSLIDFLDGDEQSSNDIAKFFQPIHRLKNAGATVVVIHHSSDKMNAETYRGSSGIRAETDVLTTLTSDEETGLLTLKQIKYRGGVKTSVTIRTDFASGELEQTDSPIAEGKRNDTATIADIIEKTHGLSQNQIREAAGMHLDKVRAILTANTNKLWRTESGKRGATLYYPMSLVPPVPTCSGTTGIG